MILFGVNFVLICVLDLIRVDTRVNTSTRVIAVYHPKLLRFAEVLPDQAQSLLELDVLVANEDIKKIFVKLAGMHLVFM